MEDVVLADFIQHETTLNGFQLVAIGALVFSVGLCLPIAYYQETGEQSSRAMRIFGTLWMGTWMGAFVATGLILAFIAAAALVEVVV